MEQTPGVCVDKALWAALGHDEMQGSVKKWVSTEPKAEVPFIYTHTHRYIYIYIYNDKIDNVMYETI